MLLVLLILITIAVQCIVWTVCEPDELNVYHVSQLF